MTILKRAVSWVRLELLYWHFAESCDTEFEMDVVVPLLLWIRRKHHE